MDARAFKLEGLTPNENLPNLGNMLKMHFAAKRVLSAVCLLFGLSFLSAEDFNGWTTARVLDGIVAANGGMQAIERVRDLRVRGEIEIDGATAEFLLIKRRPNFVRLALFHSRSSEETVFDGQRGWKRLRRPQQEVAWFLSDEELLAENLDLDFDGPLIGPPLPGVEVNLIGIERINRVDYLKVEVRDGRSRNVHFVDSRTFRELKKEVYAIEDEDKLILTSYSSDYQNHNPIWVAHTVRQVMADGNERVLRLVSVEFNIGILEGAFAAPADTLPQRPW